MTNHDALFRELAAIRGFLVNQTAVKTFHKFPHNQCDTTARLVERVLGLPVVHGEVVLSGQSFGHTLNSIPGVEQYVCLTMGQFGISYPDIMIMDARNCEFSPYSGDADATIKSRTDDLLKQKIDELYFAYASQK